MTSVSVRDEADILKYVRPRPSTPQNPQGGRAGLGGRSYQSTLVLEFRLVDFHEMPDQSTMTPQHARRVLWMITGAVVLILIVVVALTIYGLAHPVKHRVLLILLGTVMGPALLTISLRKTGIRGLFDSDTPIAPTSVRSALRRQPSALVVFPMVITAIIWGLSLTAIGMKEGGDSKEWLRKHTVIAVLWTMTPQVVAAYLCVALHATYTGIYIAGCIVYLTVTVAVGGLTLENGIVRFFGSYKAQASPLVILSSALICCASFGILHFAIWSMWPSEYLNMHGIEDALYFSVVTMATVGYGDIVPVGHSARLLSVLEILSGVLLLVVGVSASMTIWLQMNQPGAAPALSDSKEASASQQADGVTKSEGLSDG